MLTEPWWSEDNRDKRRLHNKKRNLQMVARDQNLHGSGHLLITARGESVRVFMWIFIQEMWMPKWQIREGQIKLAPHPNQWGLGLVAGSLSRWAGHDEWAGLKVWFGEAPIRTSSFTDGHCLLLEPPQYRHRWLLKYRCCSWGVSLARSTCFLQTSVANLEENRKWAGAGLDTGKADRRTEAGPDEMGLEMGTLRRYGNR